MVGVGAMIGDSPGTNVGICATSSPASTARLLSLSSELNLCHPANSTNGPRRRTTTPKSGITRYHLPDGRHLDLLAEGRLVNLTGPYSQGHPAEVIDMTFATMFMAAYDLVDRHEELESGLYSVPDRIDREIARRKLRTLGVEVEEETETHRECSQNWRHGDSSF